MTTTRTRIGFAARHTIGPKVAISVMYSHITSPISGPATGSALMVHMGMCATAEDRFEACPYDGSSQPCVTAAADTYRQEPAALAPAIAQVKSEA
ncbi:hypothetical protein [Streptomyces sp. RK9]|uniref:hypothetical protein n=1 Tax=Streptomyces sp. RK9 TaxID=3239284 RepID=UPI003870D348